jgi:two-component sensor histidine kinase
MIVRSQRSDRILVFATTVVLALVLGYTVWSAVDTREQQHQVMERALQNSQQLLRVRFSGLVHELEQDLRQEAAVLRDLDHLPDSTYVLDRWAPLLGDAGSLVMVAVADGFGSEVALIRTSSGISIRETREGSKTGPSKLYVVSGSEESTPGTYDTLGTGRYDPRAMLWYGKALEDVRDDPAWNLHVPSGDSIPRLQLALLIRADEQDGPFRILMFEIDPSRSSWLSDGTSELVGHGMLVIDGEGHVLDMPDGKRDKSLRKAVHEAATHWNAERPTSTFTLAADDQRFMALFTPYALNGQTLYTGVVLNLDASNGPMRTQKQTLWILGGLLTLLTVLLAVLWWRRKTYDERMREQARISRSQELRLAKVLGEREVLNREVHHRVKNNLQVVSSLLNLQAASLDDGPVREEFLRGKQRIDTLALVHHKLYALKDLRDVDLNLFITALARALADMHTPQSRTVSYEVQTNELSCDQDTAIGLGIILCELVSNSFKHAFPYAIGGHIDILVQSVEGDLHRLVVKDNGKGLAPGAQGGMGKLGLEIVEALSEQLDGSFHTRTNGGTTFEVLFRMRKGNGSV